MNTWTMLGSPCRIKQIGALRKGFKIRRLFDTMLDKPATDEHGNWKTVRTAQWEQLTSHTARRTFATLAVQRGTPIKVVMNITGHSTEREFNKYVNIAAEKNAEVFASFWS